MSLRQGNGSDSAILVILLLASSARASVVVPVEMRIRGAVMESTCIVVGSVVSSEAIASSSRERRSVIHVEHVIYGPATLDSVQFRWSTGKPIQVGSLVEVIADGGNRIEFDELTGARALWVLGDKRGLSCMVNPMLLDEPNIQELASFIEIVSDSPAPVDTSSWYSVQLNELELSSESEKKRSAFVAFLRGVVGGDE